MSRIWIIVGLAVAVPVAGSCALTLLSFAFRTTAGDAATINGPVSRIVVRGDGDVELAADARQDVALEWRSRYFLDRPDVDWRLDGETLFVDSNCGDFAWFTNCNTSFVLRLPEGVAITASTDHGDVEVSGELGSLHATTEHGDVAAENMQAPVAVASAEHGDVELDLVSPVTDVEATSEHGDVAVTVPSGEYRVDASTEHGDVSVDGGIVRDAGAATLLVATTEHGDVNVSGR